MRNARNPQLKTQAKQKAVKILQKKKMYESHLSTLQNTQYNVENAHIQTQMMKDNVDIMHTLKGTVEYQKQMMGGMNPDSVHDLMEDMRELQDDQNEINEAFQRNYEIDVGDEELDAGKFIYLFILELDELDYNMKAELDTNDLKVPGKRVVTKEENDERELNDLLK